MGNLSRITGSTIMVDLHIFVIDATQFSRTHMLAVQDENICRHS